MYVSGKANQAHCKYEAQDRMEALTSIDGFLACHFIFVRASKRHKTVHRHWSADEVACTTTNSLHCHIYAFVREYIAGLGR